MDFENKTINQFVLSKIDENNSSKTQLILKDLKAIAPLLCDEDLLKIYNKSISIHQSKIQGNGSFLEKDIVVKILDKNNILYKQQVTINNNGIIEGFNVKKKKCYHIIDFVIGENIDIGKSIIDFIVLSCKTTCRERWTQDNWSFEFIPKLFLLLTISDDYPLSKRFREGSQRKIITCLAKQNKKKDDRLFPLNYDNLLGELQVK
jgi:hypothetical protein